MKRIFYSLATLVFIGAVSIGATGAFFSDTETSSGNTFAAGAIDLKVDNSSYYNGVFSSTTSWTLADLTIQKFFNFLDLKPGDRGEDTISLHIDNNDAYLCANVKLTSNDDNGLNEPEALVDSTDGPGNGELASEVNFVWWADDGDNVLESNEHVISSGPIGALGTGGSITVPLADSQTNIWSGTGGPAPGGITQYIGKAWCFGTIGTAPLSQDGLGSTSPRTPANSTGGITCDGSLLGNETQTDSLTADVTFSAAQARNNPGYLCAPPATSTAKLTVTKVVVNNNGGNDQVSDFHLSVNDGSVTTGVTSGVQVTLPTGAYDVNEASANSAGYEATFSGDCDQDGHVTLAANQTKACTITNTELPAHITLTKVVVGGSATPNDFTMRIDGGAKVPSGFSKAVTSNTPHTITEDAKAGYHFTSITGSAKCPAVLGGTATVDEGETIACTITNTAN